MEGEKLEKYNRLVDETDEAYHHMEDASADLVNTKPTALASILALCRYIGPLFEGDDSPDLPEYISYDDDTQATPAEALCHVHFTFRQLVITGRWRVLARLVRSIARVYFWGWIRSSNFVSGKLLQFSLQLW